MEKRSLRKVLDTNNHSLFSLRYVLALATKDRRGFLTPDYSEYLRHSFEAIAPGYKISTLSCETEPDHITVGFKAEPDSPLSKFINAYKSASSRLVRKNFPETQKSDGVLTKSYCLITQDSAERTVIQDYLDTLDQRN